MAEKSGRPIKSPVFGRHTPVHPCRGRFPHSSNYRQFPARVRFLLFFIDAIEAEIGRPRRSCNLYGDVKRVTSAGDLRPMRPLAQALTGFAPQTDFATAWRGFSRRLVLRNITASEAARPGRSAFTARGGGAIICHETARSAWNARVGIAFFKRLPQGWIAAATSSSDRPVSEVCRIFGCPVGINSADPRTSSSCSFSPGRRPVTAISISPSGLSSSRTV